MEARSTRYALENGPISFGLHAGFASEFSIMLILFWGVRLKLST